MHVLDALLRLRQAALHPGLLDADRANEDGAKLAMLLNELAAVREQGAKALVFSQFTSLLDLVERRVAASGTRHERLDGKMRDRAAVVERSRTDPDCGLFLISLKAAALTASTQAFASESPPRFMSMPRAIGSKPEVPTTDGAAPVAYPMALCHPYCMALSPDTHRTTLLLDPETRRAARDLARHYECSISEAIRRAVLQQREAVMGTPPALRSRRTRALRRLFVLFADAEPEREVRRLKAQDEGF